MTALKLYEMDAVMAALASYRRELPMAAAFTPISLRDALLDLRHACGIVLENLAGEVPA